MTRFTFTSSVLLNFFFHFASAQWTVTNFNTATDVSSIKFRGTSDVWLACDTGVFLSTNNGTSFTQHGLYYPAGNIYLGSYLNDVAVINATTAVGAGLFYLGNDEMITRTVNSGANWDTVEHYPGTFLAEFTCADFPTATTGYVAGWQGRIFRSTNGGLSFSTVYTNPSITWEDCRFTSANEGVVVGEGGIVYTSNGTSFTQVLSLAGSLFHSVSFSGSTGYAGGTSTQGSLFRSNDNGATWSPVIFPYGEIYGLHVISQDTVVAVTQDVAYKTTNGGIYWEEFVLPALPAGYHAFKDIAFRGSEGYIACADGVLLRTLNGGGSTKPIASFADSSATHCQNGNYTFYNTSPAGYSFQWLYDGAPAGSSYNLNVTLSDSGTHVIALIAGNGALTDTVTETVVVGAVHFIQPLSFHADTVCPGSAGTVTVFNSQSGIQYRLRNGFNNVGAMQYGNGGTLTFSPPLSQQSITYNIYSYGTNACYTDSLVTLATVTVFPDIFIPVTKGDTLICSGVETYHVTLGSTQPGITYKLIYNGTTLDSAAGNGGQVILSAPGFHGVNVNRTLNLQAYKDAGCKPFLPVITIHLDTTYAKFNVATPAVFTGDTVSVANQSYADNYLWTFPPQASIRGIL